ncbi:SPX domain-containing protein 1-like, partial [Trifolium medium]|nr:SPX domain-containing protein 1-like [Trifolium medium]
MTNLWDQLALMEESAELKIVKVYTDQREEERRLVRFFIALRNDFEGLCGSVLQTRTTYGAHLKLNEMQSVFS